MKIVLGKHAGYCYGVRRAIDTALSAAEQGPVYCTGPLIHNRFVTGELEAKGIYAASADEIPPEATVVIRAHGLPLEELARLEAKNCVLIDATCPHVAKIHNIVAREHEKGRRVLVVGKQDHPEVEGILSRCPGSAAAQNVEEALYFVSGIGLQPLSVVCQTTFNRVSWHKLINSLKNACKEASVFDTICTATDLHQSEARDQAERSDGVIVIGDPDSSNTANLYKLCRELCPNTQFVENAAQLDKSRFDGCGRVFITAGASTPDPIIEEVYTTMTEEIKTTAEVEEVKAAPQGESFEEMLEQSLKTLHTGEKVSGIVTQINATDITVDLGVKQAGYIPLSELSDDPTYVVADNIKVGDEIEAFVVRVNDVEGWIMLSKKRLDAVKNWEVLEKAVESREIFDGIVVDQNKGGIVALVLGIRVFVPASQTGLPRDASFDDMMKTTHKMRITEVNRQRRRVVGSIKAVQQEVRREAQQKIWETIAVGNSYKGIVKSFTTYGAFIDIGGVDGMVHISELSWNRVKHPSEVLTVGQEVEVFVIALDTEKKKISLGYRKAEDNPWIKFENSFKVGDVITVKVVKFMPFGAFAEVLPGVDGLIHISQIVADRRIGKPDEALKIGQNVDVKIVGIDSEKKKISLSVRALIDPFYEMPGENEQVEETDDLPADPQEPADAAPVAEVSAEAAPAEGSEDADKVAE